MKNIRNFCIIAHIDHGKSTLADRLLELTSTLEKREMKHGQMLDTMDIEQERGITIKLCPVRMNWKDHQFNLIDTPGHVDFSYEVSRSLAACEGAILVVDAAQGIEAQTLANTYLAMEHDLEIIPVLNKIDLPAAEPERRAEELSNTLGIDPKDIIHISAKTGQNCESILDAVIERIPAPTGPKEVADENDISKVETKALIFDSNYDAYRGVVSYVRVQQGELKKGDKAFFLTNEKKIDMTEVGCFKPGYHPTPSIKAGEVGYVITGLKSVAEASVGDTLWQPGSNNTDISKATILPGYKEVVPFVFASIYTVDADDYKTLRESLEKLALNDSSLTFEPERSTALGFGFRCGFLGMLHMEIVQERLEREYDLDLIITAPSVNYKIIMLNTEEIVDLSNPSELPKRETIREIKEPWVKVELMTPSDYIGAIMELCTKRRGVYQTMQHIDDKRVIVTFEMPLASIIVDFYDALKSITSGYVSMSYEFIEYRTQDLVKMDILVAGDIVPPLSTIVHRSEAQGRGTIVVKKLKEIIPRRNFVIAIQAALGGKIIARETLSAYRKDVTSGLYGGDISRKKKLLQKQAKGKKRAKMMGRVEIPQEAFLAVLKKD
ncbi:MAG: translation elongation factor 4 [Candidatus Gracilibacteria bacterium]|nr:translation elongation factor 4 [Candidatus Gracilibacteria bacterium]